MDLSAFKSNESEQGDAAHHDVACSDLDCVDGSPHDEGPETTDPLLARELGGSVHDPELVNDPERFAKAISRRVMLLGGCSATIFAAACTYNRASNKRILTFGTNQQQEIRNSDRQHVELLRQVGGEFDDRRYAPMVREIGKRVAVHAEDRYPYLFTIINDPEPNGFSLPGGKIYVSRGMIAMAGNEAELASLIGHELGHVNARHGTQRQTTRNLTNFALEILLRNNPAKDLEAAQGLAETFHQKFSRDNEREADSLALRYMAKAGYDPSAAATLFQAMRNHLGLRLLTEGRDPKNVDAFSIFDSHPRTVERIEVTARESKKHARQGQDTFQERWNKAVDGFPTGYWPFRTRLTERAYIDRVTKVHIPLSSAQIAGTVEKTDDSILLSVADGEQPAYRARFLTKLDGKDVGWIRNVSFSRQRSVRTPTVSVDSTHWIRNQAKDHNQVTRVLRVQPVTSSKASLYVILTTKQRTSASLDRHLAQWIKEFRTIPDKDLKDIMQARIRVHDIQPGDTVVSLSKKVAFPSHQEAWLRVLNDLPDGATHFKKPFVRMIV